MGALSRSGPFLDTNPGGDPLDLWCLPPGGGSSERLVLGPLVAGERGLGHPDGPEQGPLQIVPAGWWQAAEPLGEHAYVGATVGPGFDFDDFSFGRDDATLCAALRDRNAPLQRLL